MVKSAGGGIEIDIFSSECCREWRDIRPKSTRHVVKASLLGVDERLQSAQTGLWPRRTSR